MKRRIEEEKERERLRLIQEEIDRVKAEEERQRKLREPSETMLEEQEIFDRLQETLYVPREEAEAILKEQRASARDKDGIYMENVNGYQLSFLIHWLQKKANPKYVLRKTYPKDLC